MNNKLTSYDRATMTLALSITRFWAIELALELEKWVAYAEEHGDKNPGGRDMLKTWEHQKQLLEQICPLEPATREQVNRL